MNIREAILLAAKYLPKRPTHPILNCANFSGYGDRYANKYLSATDLNTWVRIDIGFIQVDSAHDFCLALPAVKSLLNKAKGDIYATAKDDKLTMTMGSKYQFPTIAHEEFPEFPECKGDRVKISENQLAIAFSRIKKAVCKDVTKRILTGINLNVANGKAYLTATDGHYIAQTSMDWDDSQTFNITIPPKLFEILSEKCDRDIEFWHDDFYACIQRENVTIMQRTLDGKYPEVGNLDGGSSAVLDWNYRQGLLDNLAIAKAYGSKTVDVAIACPEKQNKYKSADGELILAITMTDRMSSEFEIPAHTPLWLAYSANVVCSLKPIFSYMRFDKNMAIKSYMGYDYVSGGMDYRLPVQCYESQKVTVNIQALENMINSLPKKRDLLINLDSGLGGRGMVAISALGDETNWALMPKPSDQRAEPVEVVAEPVDEAIAKVEELIKIGDEYRKEKAIATAKTKTEPISRRTNKLGDRYRNSRRDNRYYKFACQ